MALLYRLGRQVKGRVTNLYYFNIYLTKRMACYYEI
ncbi:hypothetical protein FHS68_002465 [Dyadobacter arcticus]|uniref:Uncharacterized protein n=1 Tax=Dyadobacter arcticus TaxID=1078754 RepID=A0ABX0UNQ0_9BACT|nr:hypothetical protein [Dyadobacter arcticus]